MNAHANLHAPKAIDGIWSDTNALGFSMASDPLTCSLLRTLAATKRNARFLELGSGTGLSTAWIQNGMDADSRLTTVDNDPELLAVLRSHLGGDPRLTVVCADGDEFVRSLAGKTFDFIFADTWAGGGGRRRGARARRGPGGGGGGGGGRPQ